MCVSVFLLILASSAAYFDMKTSKIPNLLLILCIPLLCILRVWGQGVYALGEGVISGFLLIMALFPFFSVGALGAGDVKLLSVLSLGLSGNAALTMLFASFFTAALWGLLRICFLKGKGDERIHLAPAILAGLLISMLSF